VASGYAALGLVSEALGNLNQAATYLVSTLGVRLNSGSQLGQDRFRSAALASELDEESADELMEIVGRHRKTPGG
jgi:hypothetical protein